MIRNKFGIGPCYFADGADGGEGAGVTSTALGGGGGAAAGAGEGGAATDTFNFEEFKSTYGKDYADKGFMQELSTPEKMFEKIDNLESMIGKKSFVPGENSTDQDWADYRNKIGLKSVDEYTFDNSSLPENVKNLHNAEVEGKLKQMMFDAGLTPHQAKIVNNRYNEIMVESHKELMDQVAEQQKQQQISDADFENIANETWGAQREEVQTVARTLIQKYTPENLKQHLATMDNKNLVIMASVLKGVSDTYISQDDLNILKGNTASGSKESLREEAQKELAKLAGMSQFDPGYKAQEERVNALYQNFK